MLQQNPRKRPAGTSGFLTTKVRWLRWLEVFALYVLPPLLVLPQWVHIREMIFGVIALAGIIWIIHSRVHGIRLLENPYSVKNHMPDWQPVLRRALLRFAICTPLLLGLTWLLVPEHFFGFPSRVPHIWLMVMIGYPLLSVTLQEFPYRQLFFSRYASLLSTPQQAYLLNAVLFAWLHLPYVKLPQGEWTLLLALIAGFFFADTYMRGRRFWIVWLEHALYGNLIFTIGLGRLFYYNIDALP